MQLSVAVRITVVACATAIILGVVGALVITDSPIDAGDILQGAGVLLGGLLYGVVGVLLEMALPIHRQA